MYPTVIQSVATAVNALDSSSSANAISVQLPSFCSEDPELWSINIEAQFALRNIITDDTKSLQYVVFALDTVASMEMKNVLLHPPLHNKYEALKSALPVASAKSQAQKDAE